MPNLQKRRAQLPEHELFGERVTTPPVSKKIAVSPLRISKDADKSEWTVSVLK